MFGEKFFKNEDVPALPTEFQETYKITKAQLDESEQSLTGNDPEVKQFLKELEVEDIGMTTMMLEDIGITGRNIITLFNMCGNSIDNMRTLLAGAWRGEMDQTELLSAIDTVEAGSPSPIDVKALVKKFKAD